MDLYITFYNNNTSFQKSEIKREGVEQLMISWPTWIHPNKQKLRLARVVTGLNLEFDSRD